MTEVLLQRTGILCEKNTAVLPSDFKNKLLPIVVYETALLKEIIFMASIWCSSKKEI